MFLIMCQYRILVIMSHNLFNNLCIYNIIYLKVTSELVTTSCYCIFSTSSNYIE